MFYIKNKGRESLSIHEFDDLKQDLLCLPHCFFSRDSKKLFLLSSPAFNPPPLSLSGQATKKKPFFAASLSRSNNVLL